MFHAISNDTKICIPISELQRTEEDLHLNYTLSIDGELKVPFA